MTIERFRMERYQSLHWHEVDYDLSESGVLPRTIRELLGPAADAESFLATKLGYPLSEGSEETRSNIAAWYPDAAANNVTIVNGGSEANFLALWSLLEPGDRLAFMVPNYMQGWGLGSFFGRASDRVRLRLGNDGWSLDVDQLHDAVTKRTKAIMVCNPNKFVCDFVCTPDCGGTCSGYQTCDQNACACQCSQNATCAPGMVFQNSGGVCGCVFLLGRGGMT